MMDSLLICLSPFVIVVPILVTVLGSPERNALNDIIPGQHRAHPSRLDGWRRGLARLSAQGWPRPFTRWSRRHAAERRPARAAGALQLRRDPSGPAGR